MTLRWSTRTAHPLARRAPLGGVDNCLRIGENNPGHPLTVPAQKRHNNVPAHRQAAEDDAVQFQPVEQGRDVVGCGIQRRFVVAQLQAAETPLGEVPRA